MLSSRLTAPLSHMILNEWLQRVLNIHKSCVLTALFGRYMAGATWNRCRLGARSVYPMQPRNSLQSVFIRSRIRKVYVCLSVTCHLHFWQNDRDLLRATAVRQGWNGYQNTSQHRKLTPEKKIIPPFLPVREQYLCEAKSVVINPCTVNPVQNICINQNPSSIFVHNSKALQTSATSVHVKMRHKRPCVVNTSSISVAYATNPIISIRVQQTLSLITAYWCKQ